MAIDFCIGHVTNIAHRGWCYVQGKAQMRIILDITYVIRDLLALLGEGKTNFKLLFLKNLFILSKLLVKTNFCHSEFWNFDALVIHTIYIVLWLFCFF